MSSKNVNNLLIYPLMKNLFCYQAISFTKCRIQSRLKFAAPQYR